MNQPLSNSQRYPLQDVIIADIFSANKTAFILLIGILATAVLTIWTTHQTRALVSQKGALQSERQSLEDDYRHLKLEESTQSDSNRIISIAKNLGLKAIEPEQEVVIIE